jgi:hypothetical protein
MVSLKQVARSIFISCATITAIVPSGLAYGESDRQIQVHGNNNLVAQSKKICTDREINNVHQKCKLDIKKEYEDNLSKCRRDMPSNDDSCKDLFSQIYESHLKECDDKRSKLEKQRDTICRDSQPDLNSVTQNRQSSPSSSPSTGKSRSRTRSQSKPSNSTRDNSQNTNTQNPSTDPQANNQNPTNPEPLPDKSPKPERSNPQSKPPSNSQPSNQRDTNPPCNDINIQTEYNIRNENYHEYSLRNEICSKKDRCCTRDRIFSVMTSQKNFIMPQTSLLSQDINKKVTNCSVTKLILHPPFPKVNPVQTVVDELNYSITNYTSAPHVFHPGRITRKVVQDKQTGSIFVETTGEGIGDYRRLNEFIGPPTFHNADLRLKKHVREILSNQSGERCNMGLTKKPKNTKNVGKPKVYGPVENAPGPLRDALEQIRKGKTK